MLLHILIFIFMIKLYILKNIEEVEENWGKIK